MKLKAKKLVPKVARKLKNFLTDESWKIAKKDALALWAATFVVLWVEQMGAAYHSNHSNTIHSSAPSGHLNQGHLSGYARAGHLSWSVNTTASVGSLRGHYSWVPSAHQSGYIRGGHVSQGAINTGLHANSSSSSHSNHSNY